MSRTRRIFASAFALSMALGITLDAVAQTRTEVLRWEDQSNADVTGYRVHYGPASRDYTQAEDAGIPPFVSNAFEYEIEVDATADVWVAVTAYNANGESAYSNERCRGPAGPWRSAVRGQRGDRRLRPVGRGNG